MLRQEEVFRLPKRYGHVPGVSVGTPFESREEWPTPVYTHPTTGVESTAPRR